MLSLPEDWDYTLKGLSMKNREEHRCHSGSESVNWNGNKDPLITKGLSKHPSIPDP
jgi:hypothetical protein